MKVMKIINLSFFSRYFKNNQNKKKYLKFINIGIFFSIFAITAALITFKTETTIDKLEFELTELHNEKKESSDFSEIFSSLRKEINQHLNNEANFNKLYEFNSSTLLGNKILTVNDLYLPSLFIDFQSSDFIYLQDIFKNDDNDFRVLEDNSELFYGEENWIVKGLKESGQKLREYKDFFKKDFSDYYDDIFNYDLEKIINYSSDTRVNLYRDVIYDDYKKLINFWGELENYLFYLNVFFTDIDKDTALQINENQKEIIRLSNQENQTIILAFIMQFIVFIIIQFFEISATQKELINNAKRKIK